MRRSAVSLVAGFLVFAVGSGPAIADVSDEVRSCLGANRSHGDRFLVVTTVSKDRAGGQQRVNRAQVFSRRSRTDQRTVVRFVVPEALNGATVLMIQRDGNAELYAHGPGMAGVKILKDRTETVFGTNLTFGDLLRVTSAPWADAVRRLPDEVVAGRAAYLLELGLDRLRSQYTRVVVAIDKEWCVQLRMDLYEAGREEPRKVVTSDPDQVLQIGSKWLAHSLVIRDQVEGTETHLQFGEFHTDLVLADEIFDPESLGKYDLGMKVQVDVQRPDQP